MADFKTQYDIHYEEAINIFKNTGSIDRMFEYVRTIADEDYREGTCEKLAKFFAAKGLKDSAQRFCDAIQDPIGHADAFFEMGREFRKHDELVTAKETFRQTVEAARKIKPGAWEMSAIFLQVSDELWNLREQQEALGLVREAIEEIKKYTPQDFEASKTLAGCVRVLSRWGYKLEALEAAKNIASPEQRKTVLAEIEKK